MRALSIRQPYAELILRGIKTIEYRSRRTRIIGERFYIYASKGTGQLAIGNGAGSTLTPALSQREREQLPTGVIVGSATITQCTVVRASCPNGNGARAGSPCHRNGTRAGSPCHQNGTRAGSPCHRHYQWHLSDVKRLKRPRKPKGMPQPVWFTPF